MRACPVPSHEEEDDVVCGLNEEKDDEQDSIRFAFFVKFVFRPDICGSHPANRSLVQQRFALLWGRGACGVSNCKMQKKMRPYYTFLRSTHSHPFLRFKSYTFLFFESRRKGKEKEKKRQEKPEKRPRKEKRRSSVKFTIEYKVPIKG
jgi:hypothetical protein